MSTSIGKSELKNVSMFKWCFHIVKPNTCNSSKQNVLTNLYTLKLSDGHQVGLQLKVSYRFVQNVLQQLSIHCWMDRKKQCRGSSASQVRAVSTTVNTKQPAIIFRNNIQTRVFRQKWVPVVICTDKRLELCQEGLLLLVPLVEALQGDICQLVVVAWVPNVGGILWFSLQPLFLWLCWVRECKRRRKGFKRTWESKGG